MYMFSFYLIYMSYMMSADSVSFPSSGAGAAGGGRGLGAGPPHAQRAALGALGAAHAAGHGLACGRRSLEALHLHESGPLKSL